MADNPKPPPPWYFDPTARDGRALFLQEWVSLVEGNNDHAHRMIEHSVTYGSTAIQAAYVLNGGALAALAPLTQGIATAGHASIPGIAITFVIGIAAAAFASLASYLNFQFHAGVAFGDATDIGFKVQQWYGATKAEQPASKRGRYERWIQGTLVIGIACAAASFVAFVWGALAFVHLASAFPAK